MNTITRTLTLTHTHTLALNVSNRMKYCSYCRSFHSLQSTSLIKSRITKAIISYWISFRIESGVLLLTKNFVCIYYSIDTIRVVMFLCNKIQSETRYQSRRPNNNFTVHWVYSSHRTYKAIYWFFARQFGCFHAIFTNQIHCTLRDSIDRFFFLQTYRNKQKSMLQIIKIVNVFVVLSISCNIHTTIDGQLTKQNETMWCVIFLRKVFSLQWTTIMSITIYEYYYYYYCLRLHTNYKHQTNFYFVWPFSCHRATVMSFLFIANAHKCL